MKLSFENDIALAGLLAFALIAGAVSMIVYYKNRETVEFSAFQTRVLAGLRIVGIFLCLLLFLKPVIVLRKQIKEKPTVIVAVDNSQSLSGYGNQLNATVEKIKKELSGKYEVRPWLFGETTTIGDTLNFEGNKSDYSELLASVSSYYINKKVSAMIVLGDGIYNAGQNPLNHLEKLTFPVYTVGFGDTVSVPDIRIADIKHNKTVFLNNYFSAEADIHFEKMGNQTVRLELSSGNKIIETRTIAIPHNQYFTTERFSIQATKKGLQGYRLTLISDGPEANTVNNNYEFVIDVADSKHQVLVLSDGPHPDIGTIKEILESFSNYEVTLINGSDLPENMEPYDLFVLYQLPSARNFNSKALQTAIKSNKPLLIVAGGTISLPHLNNLDLGIRCQPHNNLNESQIAINKGFSVFKLENEPAENLESFPPLYVPYTEFSISNDLQILGKQQIKGITTNQPLMAIGNLKGRKIAYLLGEGIWRWRVFDYRMNQQNKTINEFISKIFNYLVLKETEDNFNLIFSNTYPENENIIIGAELYNDSYELINDPEISMILQKDSASEFRFIFDKTGNRYSLNLGKPQTGDYRMEVSVMLGDKEYRKTGNFKVMRSNLEERQTVANHQFLYQLAYESGGRFYLPEETSQLFSEIESDKKIKPDKFVHFSQSELLNLKWLALLIIFIFGLEWFLRKYWGIY